MGHSCISITMHGSNGCLFPRTLWPPSVGLVGAAYGVKEGRPDAQVQGVEQGQCQRDQGGGVGLSTS